MKKFFRFIVLFLFVILTNLFSETLSVVTINAWSGLNYKGLMKTGEYEDDDVREFRYEILLKELKKLDPDIIALNEINMLPSYAQRISVDLGYTVVYHVGLGGIRIAKAGFPINLREGDVILAKEEYNLEFIDRRQLSGGYVGNTFAFHFKDATQIIGCKITVEGRDVYLFNTHWHASLSSSKNNLSRLLNEYESGDLQGDRFLSLINDAVKGREWRIEEAEKTLGFINDIAGENPVILMGDFNALSASEEISILKKGGFTDTYATAGKLPGYTWDELNNTNIIKYQKNDSSVTRSRIDYIFIRGSGMRVLDSRVVLNRSTYGVHPSDHFGVLTRINVLSVNK